MILFYNKKTGNIFSVIQGRVHAEDIIEKSWIQPSDTPKEDIGKYVIPYKPLIEELEEPITEMRVTNLRTMKVENVIVGKQKVKKTREMIPDVPYVKEILEIEEGGSLEYYRFNDKDKSLTKVNRV